MKTTSFDLELQTVSSGYDRQTCWVHARPGIIPGDPLTAIITAQKLRLSGDDVFYGLHDFRSEDGGKSWSRATDHSSTLGRHALGGGIEEGISDFFPGWHRKSGVLLGTGHTVYYQHDNLPPHPRPRSTAYSTYDAEGRTWAAWRKLEWPGKQSRYASEGAGSTQWLELPNGDILLPSYVGLAETANGAIIQNVAVVLRCAFDGRTLSHLEHGNELAVEGGRGLVEPSIAMVGGRYFLTLRNDLTGYVATSEDGLHYDAPRRWTFDDGADLGNYNTQQHWVTNRDNLYLVYTRRGAGNDHIMRHRAPLFIARVDPERLCILRESERVLVPQRGARLCNFGVAKISEEETWVAVAEWMQTKEPDPFDSTVCERYGSDNSVFLAKIRFPIP